VVGTIKTHGDGAEFQAWLERLVAFQVVVSEYWAARTAAVVALMPD
jgi:hypothetical protein